MNNLPLCITKPLDQRPCKTRGMTVCKKHSTNMDVQIAYAALLLTSAPDRSSSHIWMCSFLVHFNFVHLCTSKAQLTHKDS